MSSMLHPRVPLNVITPLFYFTHPCRKVGRHHPTQLTFTMAYHYHIHSTTISKNLVSLDTTSSASLKPKREPKGTPRPSRRKETQKRRVYRVTKDEEQCPDKLTNCRPKAETMDTVLCANCGQWYHYFCAGQVYDHKRASAVCATAPSMTLLDRAATVFRKSGCSGIQHKWVHTICMCTYVHRYTAVYIGNISNMNLC